MNWLRRLRSGFADWWRAVEEPFDCWDSDYPDSTPPGFVDSDQFRFVPEIPRGMRAPDTEPTSPGALDSDLSRLEP